MPPYREPKIPACADADPKELDWFPVPTDKAMLAKVVAICEGCPVKAKCLAGAIERDERYGVWAGVNFENPRARKAQVVVRQRAA